MTLPAPSEIRTGVLTHCESLRLKDQPYGRYRYAPGCRQTYWASAFVALARHLFDDLHTLTEDQRREWREYLAGGQDEATGLIIDPVFRSDERDSAMHTDELLFWHNTKFVFTALEVLGGRPRYPVRAVHPLLTPDAMTKRLEQLPWEVSPWVVGNWTCDIGSLVGYDHVVTGDSANLEAMNAFFQWMERHQLPDTGWWDLKGTFGVDHQQYGGYHTLMVYWMYNRPVPRPEAMIRSSLSLQTPEGHFGGGCCADMDVIDAAVSLSRQYDLCQDEVSAAMEKVWPWLLGKWLPGSGFRDTDGAGRAEFGWKHCACRPGEPDPCSDYFRGFSIALCTEMLSCTGFDSINWQHHWAYGHGVRPRCLVEQR